MYSDSLPSSAAQWTQLLSISTRFKFTRIRQRAIYELNSGKQIDPVEEIVLADKFDIPEWRKQAYEALVQRKEGPSHKEAERLGITTTVSLYMAREAVRNTDTVLHGTTHAPLPARPFTPMRVSQIVDDIFWPPTAHPPSPRESPGLFGPHSPPDSVRRSPTQPPGSPMLEAPVPLPVSWATWKPDLIFAPSPAIGTSNSRPAEPGDQGLFGPRTPPGSFDWIPRPTDYTGETKVPILESELGEATEASIEPKLINNKKKLKGKKRRIVPATGSQI
jgi:hypothetical protein